MRKPSFSFLKASLVPLILIGASFSITLNAKQRLDEYSQPKKYDYLLSKPFEQRHRQALQWIKNRCEIVIEVGGGKKPLSEFISDRQVIVIDPIIEERDDNLVKHVSQRFEDWTGQDQLIGRDYAVVILGLDLTNMPDHGWKNLFHLINKSKTTVIEVSTTYRSSAHQLERIKKNVTKIITKTLYFDFSKHDFRKYQTVHPYRKMMLFEEPLAGKQRLPSVKPKRSISKKAGVYCLNDM